MEVTIKKPGQRKQEMLNRFFWVRTFLLNAGKQFNLGSPQVKQRLIESVWNAQMAYTQADDDDYNFGVAVETYHIIENGLMDIGIDIEAGIKVIMKASGYSNFSQMQPLNKKVMEAIKIFEEPASVDPWA